MAEEKLATVFPYQGKTLDQVSVFLRSTPRVNVFRTSEQGWCINVLTDSTKYAKATATGIHFEDEEDLLGFAQTVIDQLSR